jgi:hypothetical protein
LPIEITARNRLDEKQFPPIVLWAWERPEDLQFIDTEPIRRRIFGANINVERRRRGARRRVITAEGFSFIPTDRGDQN